MYHTGLHTDETVWLNAGLGSTIGRVRSTPVVWPLDTWGSIRWHLHGFWNRKYSVKSILYLLGHSKLFFAKERATLKSICIISVHNWHIYSIVWGGAGQWDAHICFSTVCLHWANSLRSIFYQRSRLRIFFIICTSVVIVGKIII